MKKLSARHQAVVDFFVKYHQDNGKAPTIRDAASALGYVSAGSIHFVLRRAQANGIIIPGLKSEPIADPDIRALDLCFKALESCSAHGRAANVRYLVSRFFGGRAAELLKKEMGA